MKWVTGARPKVDRVACPWLTKKFVDPKLTLQLIFVCVSSLALPIQDFVIYWDGKKVLDAKDGTFKKPGRIGLWTKADSVTYFDDLTVESLDLN